MSALARPEVRKDLVQVAVRSMLAHQIRVTRRNRGLSQEELAKRLGTRQSAISRMESSDYGKMSIDTLCDLAAALGVALDIRLTPFTTFVKELEHGPQNGTFGVAGIEEQLPALERWAAEVPDEGEKPMRARARKI